MRETMYQNVNQNVSTSCGNYKKKINYTFINTYWELNDVDILKEKYHLLIIYNIYKVLINLIHCWIYTIY